MRAVTSSPRSGERPTLRGILPSSSIHGAADIAVAACACDAEHVRAGDLFVAIDGPDGDGHLQVEAALRRGARSVLTERLLPIDVPQCVVADTAAAFGLVCQALANHPTRALRTIGVAGGWGKTSVALLVASVLNHQRDGAAIASSLAFSDARTSTPTLSDLTTPPEFADLLARARANHCGHAIVELTTETLAARYATGVELDTLVLNNLAARETDRHGSARNLRELQLRALDLVKPRGTLVLNTDDPHSKALLNRIDRPLLTFGLGDTADVTARVLERDLSGQTFMLMAGDEAVPVRTSIVGEAHLRNCLAAATVGLLRGVSLTKIARGLEAVESIPGRMDRIDCGQGFSIFVDESRSPEALAAALKTLRESATGKTHVVFSPPTDADASLHASLGEVAERFAHTITITSEGPSQADSLRSIHNVLDGFKKPGRARSLPDRAKAIAWALEQAQPGDAVLLAGMGHRAYRESNRKKGVIDDFVVARRKLYAKDDGPRIVPFAPKKPKE